MTVYRVFSLQLIENKQVKSGYFDGNIRNQYWKSNIDGVQRAYEYSCDKASRITGATYSGKAGESYALENMAYDFNGNILSLSRKGRTGTNSTSSYLKNSWKQSDFKFSGKEFNPQTGLNDFGWRRQDPIIGRMWGIDNRAEKYYSQSPMQFAFNNPIMNVEADGDTVTVIGSQDAQKQLLQVINQGLGGYYTGNINSNGQLTIAQTNKKGEISKSQSAFAETLNQITQGKNISVGVTQNDTQVLGGSYDLETIDISDVQIFGSDKADKPTSATSILSHELVEQFHKQTNGLGKSGYDESHEKGLEAERNITGFKRDESSFKQTSGRDSFGNSEGSSQVNYIKRSKTVPVTINYRNLNITKVKQ